MPPNIHRPNEFCPGRSVLKVPTTAKRMEIVQNALAGDYCVWWAETQGTSFLSVKMTPQARLTGYVKLRV